MTTSEDRMLRVELHSYWHAGSGRGDGPNADAVILRTPDGLPFVPGRTLKGLLRDASTFAEACGHVGDGTTARLFGYAGDDDAKTQGAGTRRFTTKAGGLILGNAELGASDEARASWRQWSKAHPNDAQRLADVLRSTAIDHDGVALNQTLRAFEYAVPMTLYARVSGPPAQLDALETIIPLVRGLGAQRNRGFGRCTLALMAAQTPRGEEVTR